MSEPLTDLQIVSTIIKGTMSTGVDPEQAEALIDELFALRAENADLREKLAGWVRAHEIRPADLSRLDELPFFEEEEDEQTS